MQGQLSLCAGDDTIYLVETMNVYEAGIDIKIGPKERVYEPLSESRVD